MAEIKIEKKKPVWPWIILVLVILAILYFLFFVDGDNDRNGTDDVEQVEDTTVWENEQDTTTWNPLGNDTLSTNAVSEYVTYIGNTTRMGIGHG